MTTHPENWAAIMEIDARTRREERARQEAAEAAIPNLDIADGTVIETVEERNHRIETARRVLEALAPLLAEELKGNTAESYDEWTTWKQSIAPLNGSVIAKVRNIALRESNPYLDWLERVLNTALSIQTDEGLSMETRSITAAIVSEAWTGVCGWQR